MELNSALKSSIKEALNRSESDLFQELGTLGGKNATVGDSVKRGKEIFENLKERVPAILCTNNAVRTAGAAGNEVVLVAAILDCISGYVTSLSPVSAAVLLVKFGVDRLCTDYPFPLNSK